MKYFNIFLILIIIIIFPLQKEEKYIYNYMVGTNYITFVPKIKQEEVNYYQDNVIETFYGIVTAYEPNCDGCIGITASGYNVRNTIYYNDIEYGKTRIIAASSSIPFGTIIKLSDLGSYEDIIAIVLDRGGAIGFDTNAQADLLFYTENEAYSFGRKYDVKFEILRLGF